MVVVHQLHIEFMNANRYILECIGSTRDMCPNTARRNCRLGWVSGRLDIHIEVQVPLTRDRCLSLLVHYIEVADTGVNSD